MRSARRPYACPTADGSSSSRAPTTIQRRRRVLLALLGLNLVDFAGVFLVGPGFWIGFSVSFVVLLVDLLWLRRTKLAADRRQRKERQRKAWVAAQQAAVRREHERRAAERQARLAVADRRIVSQRTGRTESAAVTTTCANR